MNEKRADETPVMWFVRQLKEEDDVHKYTAMMVSYTEFTHSRGYRKGVWDALFWGMGIGVLVGCAMCTLLPRVL